MVWQKAERKGIDKFTLIRTKNGKDNVKFTKNFVEYLEQVNALVKEAGFDKSKDTLIKSIQERELLVPVVGGFSAGKSTAINAFLGEDILSVAITPETALATELRYTDGESYVEGVKENGQSLSLTEFSTLKDRASEFQFVRLYLNNKRLKDIAPIVLVEICPALIRLYKHTTRRFYAIFNLARILL